MHYTQFVQAAFITFFFLFDFGCKCKDKDKEVKKDISLESSGVHTKEGGKVIEFPPDAPQLGLFKSQKIVFISYDLNINAPATVTGRIKKSDSPGLPSIILFASPDLTSAYASYLQNGCKATDLYFRSGRISSIAGPGYGFFTCTENVGAQPAIIGKIHRCTRADVS